MVGAPPDLDRGETVVSPVSLGRWLVYEAHQLAHRLGKRAGLVDGDRSRSSHPFFGDEAGVQEPVDFAHDRRLVDVDGACQIGQGPGTG